MEDVDTQDGETHFDRRKNYRELVASGVPDGIAKEQVWPSTTAGVAKKAKEAADKKEKKGTAPAV